MLVRIGFMVAGNSDGGFIPTIESFALLFPSKNTGCAPVGMVGMWVMNNADNENFKLRILETGDEYACATSFDEMVYTEETYLDGLGETVQPTLTLQVVRRSDNNVMSYATATSNSSIAVGGLC